MVSFYSHFPNYLPGLHIYIRIGLQHFPKYKNGGKTSSLQCSHFTSSKPLWLLVIEILSNLLKQNKGLLFKSFQENHRELSGGKNNWVLSRSNDCVPEIYQASFYTLETKNERDQQKLYSHGLYSMGKTDIQPSKER